VVAVFSTTLRTVFGLVFTISGTRIGTFISGFFMSKIFLRAQTGFSSLLLVLGVGTGLLEKSLPLFLGAENII